MPRETTDTRFQITPAGKWKMTCTKPCVKMLTSGGKPYYKFFFEFMDGDKLISHHEMIFPSQAATLLRAFKCKETETGVFDWDKEEVSRKKIIATVIHEADKKDSSKMRAKISEAEPLEEESIPF